MLNNKFYIQVHGVAMGSPLGPILANIFLSHHEENWLNKCPIEFKPSFYRRYVDDMYFLNHLNLPARFVNMYPLNIRTWTSPMNRKVLAHFRFYTSKFVLKNINLWLVFTKNFLHTLLHRSFSICYDFKTFHFKIDHLKAIFIKNNYPLSFTDSCIKSFLNKLYTPKIMVPNVPKRNVFVKLPFCFVVLPFKFERSFKYYWLITWRLVI